MVHCPLVFVNGLPIKDFVCSDATSEPWSIVLLTQFRGQSFKGNSKSVHKWQSIHISFAQISGMKITFLTIIFSYCIAAILFNEHDTRCPKINRQQKKKKSWPKLSAVAVCIFGPPVTSSYSPPLHPKTFIAKRDLCRRSSNNNEQPSFDQTDPSFLSFAENIQILEVNWDSVFLNMVSIL